MVYEEGAVMTIWNIITEYIHDDEVLYLKEVSDKWIRMKFNPYQTLHNYSLVSIRYVKNISQNVKIKKQNPEILALIMKELPKDQKYPLSLLEGSNNVMRSCHWIKTKLVHFT